MLLLDVQVGEFVPIKSALRQPEPPEDIIVYISDTNFTPFDAGVYCLSCGLPELTGLSWRW